MIQVPKLIKVFGGALSNMYCIMMSFIEGPPKICCLSAWDQIRQEWLWEKSMKACGTHQSAPKMKWLLRRADFYWPTMMADCFCYYKGCEECQKFGNIQLVPAAVLHPIIKPWPFRGWGLDFIGQIHPPSLKGH